MTREEQLDALIREAIQKAGDLPQDMDAARSTGHSYSPVYGFTEWLRAEFIRTQAP